eukprot:CAMPEP_0172316660 /NCGR_PEP_ID=MMETSP1058-20130122/29017_1 /TAXON_ID=83371 /ORGANISM="Detonula confervacea, Strain CCMP 353" /LENGTH=462 /DNA_ID=CAMNT_0013031019 /DNA_START=25 /DNA_END=1413 /DNA_ORIENTATION=+
MILLSISRAKPLQASIFLIKPVVRDILAFKNIHNQPAKAAFSSTLGSLSSTPPRAGDVASLSWWCSRGSLSREGRIRIRHLSAGAAASSCHSSSNSDAEPNDEPAEASSRQARWDCMLDALASYKAMHGDTFVPGTYPENQQLANWVDNQRQLYRMRFEVEELGENVYGNKYSNDRMTDERIEKLNSIDFVWSHFEHSWSSRYEELKEYVAEHGNSLVPWNFPLNESLGMWVSKQRRNKVRQQGGNEAILSSERMQKLDAVGFVWEVHEAQWFERLEELKSYRMSNGDTLVPKIHPILGRWVDKQRLDHRRYKAKMKMEELWGGIEVLDEEVKEEMKRVKRLGTGMTEERIRLLDAEGFIWDAFAHQWELKFEDLCSFVALNGHAAIRERRGSKYDPLGRWAATQRKNYRKYKDGQRQTTLTEERVKRLNSLGFAWEISRTVGASKRRNTEKLITKKESKAK